MHWKAAAIAAVLAAAMTAIPLYAQESTEKKTPPPESTVLTHDTADRFSHGPLLPDPGRGGPLPVVGPVSVWRATDEGVTPLSLDDGFGGRISLETLVGQVAAQPDVIAAVAALLDYPRSDLAYIVYDIRTVEDAFTFRQSPRWTLELGGGECSDFHTLGAYLLRQAGGFGPDDVYVLQTFGVGGMHNVIVYRDPDSGLWNIMNYGRIFRTAVSTPRQAVEAVFGNPGRYEVYRAGGADDDVFTIHHLDRDTFTAVMQGLQYLPGLKGMDGVFGSVPGLSGTAPRDRRELFLEAGNRDVGAVWQGVSVRVRLDDAWQPSAAGLGWLSTPSSPGDWILGAKCFAPNGQSIFAAFEFGLLQDSRWHWTSLGAGYRAMGSNITGWVSVPQAVPFAAHQQGARYPLVGAPSQNGFWLAAEWNAHVSVGLPLVLTEEGRRGIADASNDLAGVIDPNAFGWAMLGADAGVQTGWRFSRELAGSVVVRYRGELNDPTLQPLLSALEVTAGLEFRAPGGAFTFEAAGTPLGGVWAHDVLYRTALGGRLSFSSFLSMEAALSVGQYVDRSVFVYTREAATFRVDERTSVTARHTFSWVNGLFMHAFGIALDWRY